MGSRVLLVMTSRFKYVHDLKFLNDVSQMDIPFFGSVSVKQEQE